MGQGRHALRSISDPVYPDMDTIVVGKIVKKNLGAILTDATRM